MTVACEQFQRPVEILLVEDNPADIRLMREVFREANVANRISVVMDGEQAMAFLRHEGPYHDVHRPDLVLLDLNLPRKDGRQVLAEIRDDPRLTTLPVVVLSTSTADVDVRDTYQHHANVFMVKPIGFEEFV